MKYVWMGLLAGSIALASYVIISLPGCGGDGNLLDTGVCLDSCPLPCNVDQDCKTSSGEKCCDFGGDGKACIAADQCPTFCTQDTQCDTPKGEGCVRVTLQSDEKICTKPSEGIKLCSDTSECGTGEKCCAGLKEKACVPADECPDTCSADADCHQEGQTCCTTFNMVAPDWGGSGACVNAKTFTCPKKCSSSNDCTGDAKLCCDGLCASTCAKACTSSNDCSHQLCCRTSAIKSPFAGRGGIDIPSTGTGTTTTTTSNCGALTYCTTGNTSSQYRVCASTDPSGTTATYEDASGNTICSFSSSSSSGATTCANMVVQYCQQ